MKKVSPILIGILLHVFQLANAQHTGISVTGGIGQYNLNELTVYQDELINKFPLDIQTLSSFPAYTSFRISYTNQNLQGFKYEFVYAYSTTGMHSNYRDYTGYMNLDQTLTAYQLGLGGAYRLLYRNGMELMAYGDLRLAYVTDHVNMSVITSYYIQNNSIRLKKVTPFAEAGVEFLKHFKTISLGLQGGYCQDLIGKFSIPDADGSTNDILIPSGNISSRMSGLRVGIKFILWFNSPPGVEFSL